MAGAMRHREAPFKIELAGRYISRRTGDDQIARFRLRICCVHMLGPAKHELWHYNQRRDEEDRNDKRSWHGDPFDRRVPTNFMVINKGFLSDGASG